VTQEQLPKRLWIALQVAFQKLSVGKVRQAVGHGCASELQLDPRTVTL
jgi:hypothetical protein